MNGLIGQSEGVNGLVNRLAKEGLPTTFTDKNIGEIIAAYCNKTGTEEADAIEKVDKLAEKVKNNEINIDTFRFKVSGMRAGMNPLQASLTFDKKKPATTTTGGLIMPGRPGPT